MCFLKIFGRIANILIEYSEQFFVVYYSKLVNLCGNGYYVRKVTGYMQIEGSRISVFIRVDGFPV